VSEKERETLPMIEELISLCEFLLVEMMDARNFLNVLSFYSILIGASKTRKEVYIK
jgi:hypothetical protein